MDGVKEGGGARMPRVARPDLDERMLGQWNLGVHLGSATLTEQRGQDRGPAR
jgi:hypothetical protein